jgi:hypothetical protein
MHGQCMRPCAHWRLRHIKKILTWKIIIWAWSVPIRFRNGKMGVASKFRRCMQAGLPAAATSRSCKRMVPNPGAQSVPWDGDPPTAPSKIVFIRACFCRLPPCSVWTCLLRLCLSVYRSFFKYIYIYIFWICYFSHLEKKEEQFDIGF